MLKILEVLIDELILNFIAKSFLESDIVVCYTHFIFLNRLLTDSRNINIWHLTQDVLCSHDIGNLAHGSVLYCAGNRVSKTQVLLVSKAFLHVARGGGVWLVLLHETLLVEHVFLAAKILTLVLVYFLLLCLLEQGSV